MREGYSRSMESCQSNHNCSLRRIRSSSIVQIGPRDSMKPRKSEFIQRSPSKNKDVHTIPSPFLNIRRQPAGQAINGAVLCYPVAQSHNPCTLISNQTQCSNSISSDQLHNSGSCNRQQLQ
ncbi:hypothetical protein SAMD00019534_054220, partial [Acytostelium subglobosum LB1]|uniref:hypothetical protein n=1 Tax=Acytostelium subglobosum LB1 TaxID=1410327 RepID=UPI0006448127